MSAPCDPTDRQRNATLVHHSQREMPFLSVTRPPEEVAMDLVSSCKDELMAINRCIDLSGLSGEYLCDALGIDKGHWSRIRSGRAHFPAKKRLKLMELAGNILPIQFEALKMGRALVDARDIEIAHLRTRLAEAEARRVA